MKTFYRILILVFFMLPVLGVSAQDNTDWEEVASITKLLVWENDDTYTIYMCSDHPEVYIEKESLVLSVNNTKVLYPANEVRRFTFADDSLTPIEETKLNGSFNITENLIQVFDLHDSDVSIYDMSGRLVRKERVIDGMLDLNISDLQKGVYVVKAGNVNFKFQKP